jgi:LmbE family N-acetylglucosaminyl deacetylase
LDFTSTQYVDRTDTIEQKLEMLEKHGSQMKWMRDHNNIDFAEF